VWAAWTIFFGLAMLWAKGVPGALGLRTAGAVSLTFGLVAAADVVRQLRAIAPPEPAVTTFEGVPATVVLRDSHRFSGGLIMRTALAAPCVLWAYPALHTRLWVWTPICVAGAVALLGPVVLARMGRYVAGGIWLTPHGMTYRSRGLQTTVSWDDLLGGIAVRRAGGVVVCFGSRLHHSFRAGPWRGEQRPPARLGYVRTHHMAVGPVGLLLVQTHYLLNPDARAELGTPASLTTIAHWRAKAAEVLADGPLGIAARAEVSAVLEWPR